MRTPAELTSLLQDAFANHGHCMIVRYARLSDSFNFEVAASGCVNYLSHGLFLRGVFAQLFHQMSTTTTVTITAYH